jgi:hypothetical protein
VIVQFSTPSGRFIEEFVIWLRRAAMAKLLKFEDSGLGTSE